MSLKNLNEQLGGNATLRELVDKFYNYMDTLPEAATIRAMHPADISDAAQKLYEFLSGWTGGPQLYQEKYGHPRLRARHLPFKIDSSARDQWMLCMKKAIAETIVDKNLARNLEEKLFALADFMRNTEESELEPEKT